MKRISICLLVAVLLAPAGCAEMNPWSTNKFPEPKTPPDSLQPVSAEGTTPGAGQHQPLNQGMMPSRPMNSSPQQGLPRGMTPADLSRMGPMPTSQGTVFPENVSQSTFSDDYSRLQQEWNSEMSQPGFAQRR